MVEELNVTEFNSIAGGELNSFDDYLISVGGGMLSGALAASEFGPLGMIAGGVFGGVDASLDYGMLNFANSAL
ncbi:hypothetical protein HF289_09635 [Acidithiobacillus ferrooxidans]|jgi:hypothetical protein|uniref:hypothetical protein n=1 Tax=Acidithiobacillus TaxID=119977 RepID=UPI0013D1EE19|nr:MULTISPECIES: hypothetical protein [Acidithiobacillus]MBU2857119.1 hypothetical protein [Acidithiobacillus ferrooxidans]MBU2861153.1 hypothetical protein [Acidithiobacillus ferrooxidans]MCR2828723.1 hypothetical protein [Acidithiobacillus ferrooxidans]MDA8153603.1 hypothetical protein [Acidithiobacillus sp.]